MLPSWRAGNMMSSWIFSQLFLSLSLAADGCCLPRWRTWIRNSGKRVCTPSELFWAPESPLLSPSFAGIMDLAHVRGCHPGVWHALLQNDSYWLWDAALMPSLSLGDFAFCPHSFRRVSHSWDLVACPSPRYMWLYSSWNPNSQSWEAFEAKFKHRHRLHLDFLLSLKARCTFWRAFCTC